MITTSAAQTPASRRRDADRWLFWLTPAIFTAVLTVALSCGLPGLLSFILIPIAVLGGLPLAITGILLGLWFVFCGRWRSGASLTVPIALSMLLIQQVRWTADLLHLGLTIGFGIGELPDTLPSPADNYQAHDWSVGLAGGPNTFLLHDITDGLAGPLRQFNAPASEQSVEDQCAGRSEYLIAHYYVCSF